MLILTCIAPFEVRFAPITDFPCAAILPESGHHIGNMMLRLRKRHFGRPKAFGEADSEIRGPPPLPLLGRFGLPNMGTSLLQALSEPESPVDSNLEAIQFALSSPHCSMRRSEVRTTRSTTRTRPRRLILMHRSASSMIGISGSKPPTARKSARRKNSAWLPTATLENATGRELSEGQHEAAQQLVHYSIGVGPAAAYALVRDKLPGRGPLRGLLYGFGVFLVQDEVLNAGSGLGADPRECPWQDHARGLVAHLAYGVTTELALNAMEHALVSARQKNGLNSAIG